ncbi:MAG TPA: glycosyl hydrolase family 8 [Opitutaceae bacterium]|nr:glycosyl hydrolase family 8 [Opitutaceae bacterium]
MIRPPPAVRGRAGPLLALAAAGILAVTALRAAPPAPGAFATGRYRDLFKEDLGRSDAEVDAKLQAAWQQLFYGRDDTQRVYYPVAGDMAYVADILHRDVRTEGLSYAMMIAVQLNRQAEFNRIWKWANVHMYHASGPLAGYYAWHCRYDGTPIHAGPAPDGEEWFVMSLFFAAHRWGGGEGIFNYEHEAQTILRTMIHKGDGGDGAVTSMFDREHHQVVFVPSPRGSQFTDPSYHLPAFYELWARWAADPADRALLAGLAPASRELFRHAANPRTGLMPDYANFDGTPHVAWGHEDFRFDAYRTLSNVALDYAWFAQDPWAVAQSNRVLAFLRSQGPHLANQFTLDGRPLTDLSSPGLPAMAAVAALAADSPDGPYFVRNLWTMDIPSGSERYYDGLLYFLALLEVSGRFRIYGP